MISEKWRREIIRSTFVGENNPVRPFAHLVCSLMTQQPMVEPSFIYFTIVNSISTSFNTGTFQSARRYLICVSRSYPQKCHILLPPRAYGFLARGRMAVGWEWWQILMYSQYSNPVSDDTHNWHKTSSILCCPLIVIALCSTTCWIFTQPTSECHNSLTVILRIAVRVSTQKTARLTIIIWWSIPTLPDTFVIFWSIDKFMSVYFLIEYSRWSQKYDAHSQLLSISFSNIAIPIPGLCVHKRKGGIDTNVGGVYSQ